MEVSKGTLYAEGIYIAGEWISMSEPYRLVRFPSAPAPCLSRRLLSDARFAIGRHTLALCSAWDRDRGEGRDRVQCALRRVATRSCLCLGMLRPAAGSHRTGGPYGPYRPVWNESCNPKTYHQSPIAVVRNAVRYRRRGVGGSGCRRRSAQGAFGPARPQSCPHKFWSGTG
jgi:hypothetical protein